MIHDNMLLGEAAAFKIEVIGKCVVLTIPMASEEKARVSYQDILRCFDDDIPILISTNSKDAP